MSARIQDVRATANLFKLAAPPRIGYGDLAMEVPVNKSALLPLLLLTACPPGVDDTALLADFDEYTMDEGGHYSTYAADPVTGSIMPFQAFFDDSAIYTNVDPVNQADINKLYGFSDCSSLHHTNSARFGWRWYGKALQIHAYTYVDTVRQSTLLGTVDLDTIHDYSIELDGAQYLFTLDGITTTMPRGCADDGGLRYQLYPYFGGDETAPHDITIWIKDL